MSVKMTPPRTPYHMMNYLCSTALISVQKISDETEIHRNRLFDARSNPEYRFRTPYYADRLKRYYMKERGFEDFPDFIEAHLDVLRTAYEMANAEGQAADNTRLKAVLANRWQMADPKGTGDLSGTTHEGARHYVAGSMMLVANLRKIKDPNLPEDTAQRAIYHFSEAYKRLTNPALRHRALLSLAAAKQRKFSNEGTGFQPLNTILTEQQLKQLLVVQSQQTNNSVTDAVNAVKLASVLQNKDAMLSAELDLFTQDSRFEDMSFEGWSPISPAMEDPDLAYYRQIKCH